MKKIIIWVGGIFIALCIIGAIFGDDTENAEPTTQNESVTATTGTAVCTEVPTEAQVKNEMIPTASPKVEDKEVPDTDEEPNGESELDAIDKPAVNRESGIFQVGEPVCFETTEGGQYKFVITDFGYEEVNSLGTTQGDLYIDYVVKNIGDTRIRLSTDSVVVYINDSPCEDDYFATDASKNTTLDPGRIVNMRKYVVADVENNWDQNIEAVIFDTTYALCGENVMNTND